ncbi:MAG: penicillin-binding protein 2 [Deltaproteobacteria bacterium]|nr:penicillin-binding protein 2 [Deltaproteobacteria bacterium]
MSQNLEKTYEDNPEKIGWLIFLKVAMVAVFSIFVLRLWFLQIDQGQQYLENSYSNQFSSALIPTSRGLVTDRHGRPLVENEVVFEVSVIPKNVIDPEALTNELAILTGASAKDLLEKFKSYQKSRPYSSSILISGLNRADLALIESRKHEMAGLSVEINSVRKPIKGDFAPHVIGYIGEISQDQLDGGAYPGYRRGDLVGQSGVEQSLEGLLHGQKGSRQMTVDSKGRMLEELSVEYPQPGYDIKLTLDSRLQRVAQSLLGEQAGAIVVMDPRNFEILALASSPIFNLSDFVGGISSERWRSLNEDPFSPMQNRAVNGQYSPGSTFKIAVSLAALAEGVITPETAFTCAGALRLGNHSFGCWNRHGHGYVNLHNSLKHSCDVYYYEVGRRLGVDRLAARVREFFGLGRTLGLELKSEKGGLVPDQAWKMRRYGRGWNQGETLPVSIGQGYLLTTPLQVAQYTAVLANGGTLYRPHLVKEIFDFDGRIVHNSTPEVLNQMSVSPEYINSVKKGMEAVVNDPGGTGRRARLPDVKVAGKTGTTQTVSLEKYQGYSAANRPYKMKDHAWFTSYAPADNPEVVVTVLLEHTGGGGTKSAPVAAKMMAAYFDTTIDTNLMPPYQVQPDKPTGWKGDL